jgi:hypothetical protein
VSQLASQLGQITGVMVNQTSMEKEAFIGKLVSALGGKAFGKAFRVAKGSFSSKPFTSLGKSVVPGVHQAERTLALQRGNEFMTTFKPRGFKTYAGRVKTPKSILEHGSAVPDDLLGMRLRSSGNYSRDNVNDLVRQLRAAGVDVSGASRKFKPGYHGWNIKGTMGGSTPVEFQLSPRRLQGLTQFDHMTKYKPQESGVMPWFGKNILQLPVRYGMGVMSPFNSMRTRMLYGGAPIAGGVGIAEMRRRAAS